MTKLVVPSLPLKHTNRKNNTRNLKEFFNFLFLMIPTCSEEQTYFSQQVRDNVISVGSQAW